MKHDVHALLKRFGWDAPIVSNSYHVVAQAALSLLKNRLRQPVTRSVGAPITVHALKVFPVLGAP